jgi:hypothetical protein
LVHGAVSPRNVPIVDSGAVLLKPPPGDPPAPEYRAPEQALGTVAIYLFSIRLKHCSMRVHRQNRGISMTPRATVAAGAKIIVTTSWLRAFE